MRRIERENYVGVEELSDCIEDLADIIDDVQILGEYIFQGKSMYTKPIDREEHEKEIISSGGWMCKCGSVNASYVGTCKCGGTKSEDSVPYAKKEKWDEEWEEKCEEVAPETLKRPKVWLAPEMASGWICSCGKKNPSYQSYCSCGGLQTEGTPFRNEVPAARPIMKEKQVIQKTVQEPIQESVQESVLEPVVNEISELLREPEQESVVQVERVAEEKEELSNERFANPFKEEEKEWKCPTCGAIRPSFMAICECGTSKRDNI